MHKILKDTIIHWKEIYDVLHDKPEIINHTIKTDDKSINYGGRGCPFCRIYNDNCNRCPYYIITGKECYSEGEVWDNFSKEIDNESLSTAAVYAKQLIIWLYKNRHMIERILNIEHPEHNSIEFQKNTVLIGSIMVVAHDKDISIHEWMPVEDECPNDECPSGLYSPDPMIVYYEDFI